MAYKRFGVALNALMPNHARQEDLNDLKWMAYVRAGAKARFEPEDIIDISDCGEKAKELISEHLKSNGVYQWIQPITLFDKGFRDKINHGSDEAIASSMEHAIKYAINVKMKDNPVHYTSLLERLMKILEDTNMNWEERRKQLEEFIEREMKHGEEDQTRKLGFTDRRQFAIYEAVKKAAMEDKVAESAGYYSAGISGDIFSKIALDIEKTIMGVRVKGFRTNTTRLSEMETALYNMLLSKYYDELGFDTIARLTNPLIDLAKIHYDDME